MKGILFLLSLFFIHQISFSQHDLYIGGEVFGGTLGSTDLESGLLNKKNYSPTLGAQLNLNYRLFDFLSFEGGIGQQRSRIKLKDAAFADELDGFSININNTNYHWNYFAAVSAFYKIGKTDTYVYGKFAVSKNVYGAGQVSKSESFEVTSKNIDRSLVYTTTYSESNISYIPEVGLQYKFFEGNLLSVGFRYNLGQSQVFESNYSITDNIMQETKSDRLTSMGDAFSFTVRFDYKLFHLAKREKVKKVKLNEIAIDVSKKDEVKIDNQQGKPDTLAVPSATIDTTLPASIANRDLVIKDRLKVHFSKVKVQIWDHQTVDGDRVSLNLNGEWILKNYELTKEKYEIEIELREGPNTFVLHALNLGKYKPNTAALIVFDGEKKHRIILESNMNESGTLQINYKKKKNETK
ncbi:hypothetical protein OAD50_02525 [Vicingaceae bacterium]|nr:hypothetical protein [Vicingaceae bacterium]